jgi:hypothetical protein
LAIDVGLCDVIHVDQRHFHRPDCVPKTTATQEPTPPMPTINT